MEKIKERIKEDLSLSIKRKDKKTCSVLRMVLSAILSREKEYNYRIRKEKPEAEDIDISDEEALAVIFSEFKKRKDSISEFEKGKRDDLVQKEKEEIEILEKYLPKQLSEKEIREVVEKVVKETSNFGEAMSKVMLELKGKADGSLVSKIVKETLTVSF